MPQMAPLSWLPLFVLFTIPLVFSCVMNYFSSLPSPSAPTQASEKVNTSSFNWKW